MSKGGQTPDAVMEWGPTHAVILNLASNLQRTGTEIGDAAQVLNGHRNVVAAVSRRSAFVRALRVPDTGKQEVAQILRLQLAGLFPVPEAELAYDFRLTEDVNAEGRLAVVGAMRETDLLRLHAEARASGLKVSRVLPAAFGSMLLAKELGLPTCAVVQPTVEGLAIDIIADGELRYTRLTPASDAETIEAEILRTFTAAGVSPGPIVATEGVHIPNAIDARTTTLQALGRSNAFTLHVNLEPAEVTIGRERRRQSSRTRMAVLMCAAALLLALTVFLQKSDAQAKVDKKNAADQKTLNDHKKLRDGEMQREGEATKLVKVINQAFKPGQPLSDVISVLTNDAPEGLWVTSIQGERAKLVTVHGISFTNEAIATYMQKLTDEVDQGNPMVKRFRGVTLSGTNVGTIGEKPIIDFTISAFPVGNTPVVDPKAKGAKS